MGFLGTIISGVSSFFSGVCSVVGKICSAIGGALSKFGSAVSDFVERINTAMPELFPRLNIGDVIQLIGKVISTIAEFLGIKEEEKDDPEELGMKAEVAEKKPEDFDSTEEYIKYLQNEVSIDQEKKKNLTPEEKAAYTAVGSKLYLDATSQKLGVDEITPETLLDYAKLQMDAKEIVTYIEKLRDAGFKDQKAMDSFLRGKGELNADETGKVTSAMESALKELNPELGEEAIADKILDMMDDVRSTEG